MLKRSLFLAAVLVSGAASANSLYVKGTFGPSHVDDPEFENGHSFSGFVGVDVSPNVSVELGYTYFGEMFVIDNIDASAFITGVSTSALFKLPISDKLNVFGKLGLLAWSSELNIYSNSTGSNSNTVASNSGTDLMFGVGAEYLLTRNLALLLEHQTAEIEDTALSTTTAGARLIF